MVSFVSTNRPQQPYGFNPGLAGGTQFAATQAAPAGDQSNGFADFLRDLVPQRVRDDLGHAVRELGDLYGFVDEPLVRRLGIDLPGPIGFVADELTRPTNLLVAAGGAGIATRAARSASPLIRAAGAFAAPVGGSGFLERAAGEALVSTAARAAAEQVNDLLPESTPTGARIAIGLLSGAAGGAAAIGATRAGVRQAIGRDILVPTNFRLPEATPEPVDTRIGSLLRAKTADTLGPNYTVDDVLDVARDLEAQSTSQVERMYARGDVALRRIGDLYQDDTRQWRVRGVARGGEDAVLQELLEFGRNRFPQLTDNQVAAIADFQEIVRDVFVESDTFGVPRELTDLEVGQTYVPRAALKDREGREIRAFKGAGARLGGGKDRAREFRDPALAVQAGVVYDNPLKALEDYADRSFKLARDTHIANLVKPLGQTATDRIPPELRKQVGDLRAMIRSRRDTLVREGGQFRAEARTAKRAARAANSADVRTAQGARRFAQTAAKLPSPEEIAWVRDDITAGIADGRKLAREIGAAEVRLRQGKGELSQVERQIVARARKLEAELDAADQLVINPVYENEIARLGLEQTGETLTATRAQYRTHVATARKLEREIDKLQDQAETMFARVDRMLNEGELLSEIDQASRAQLADSRAAERVIARHERQLAAAERELRVLDTEAGRRAREGVRELDRTVATGLRRARREVEYDRLRDELRDVQTRLRIARARATSIPPDRAVVASNIAPLLNGRDFEKDTAKQLSRFYSRGLVQATQPAAALNAAKALNTTIVPLRAMGDVSALFNQLGVLLATHPVRFGRAVGQSFGDAFTKGGWDRYERFLADQAGDGASHGLAIMGGAGKVTSDFEFGSWLARLPGLKQFQRQFQAVTTRNRVDLYNHYVDMAQRLGRPLDDRAREEVARSLNRITGVAVNRAGDLETVALFAPNFLRASLELLGSAVSDGGMEGQIARQYLRNFVLAGQGLAVAGATGIIPGTEERPLSDVLLPLNPRALARGELALNPNFGTVRVGSQDVSLYGRYDSLARLAVTSMDSLSRAISERDARELFDAMGYFFQTKGSPIGANITNAILGQNFQGDPFFSGQYLMSEPLPFAASGFIEDFRSGGSWQDIAGGAALNFVGAKANRTTAYEQLQEAARQRFGRDLDSLDGRERQVLSESLPNLNERANRELARRAKAGDDEAAARLEFDAITERRLADEQTLALQFQAGEIQDVRQFSEALEELQRRASTERDQTLRVLGVEFGVTQGEKAAVDAYFDTYDRAEIAPGVIDFELREQLERELRVRIAAGEFGDPQRAMGYLDNRAVTQHAPEVDWYYEARETIRASGYYDVPDAVYAQLGQAVRATTGADSYGEALAQLQAAKRRGDAGTATRLQVAMRRVDAEVERRRTVLRLQNKALDDALVAARGLVPVRQRRR